MNRFVGNLWYANYWNKSRLTSKVNRLPRERNVFPLRNRSKREHHRNVPAHPGRRVQCTGVRASYSLCAASSTISRRDSSSSLPSSHSTVCRRSTDIMIQKMSESLLEHSGSALQPVGGHEPCNNLVPFQLWNTLCCLHTFYSTTNTPRVRTEERKAPLILLTTVSISVHNLRL